MTVGSYQAVSQDVSDTVKAWLLQSKRRLTDPSVKQQEISLIAKNVCSNIADVLTLRSLLSQSHAADRDLQDCSRAMAVKLDAVSRVLSLDSVVRDPDDGTVLLPHSQIPNIVISKQRATTNDVISRHQTTPFFAVLDEISARLPLDLLPTAVTSQLCLQFYIYMPSQMPEIKISSSGIMGVGEMTEQFTLTWDRNGTDQTCYTKQSAVFDLSSFQRQGIPGSNRIFLICVAFRLGSMKSAVLNEEGRPSGNDQLTSNIRRPVGIGVLDLFPSSPVKAGTETRFQSLRKTRRPSHISMSELAEGYHSPSFEDPANLLSWQDPAGSSYTLNLVTNTSVTTLTELANESANTVPGGLVSCCQINLRLTLLNTPPLVSTNAALQSKAAPLCIEPVGFRNLKVHCGEISKFYVTLLDGFLSRLGSNRKTNAEVNVYSIRQQNADKDPPTTSPVFRSSVHDATERPTWNEMFLVDIDDPSVTVHLLFVIRMRSSRAESDRKAERDRFFAYFPLTWRSEGDALIAAADGTVALAVYRFSHLRDALPPPTAYLSTSMSWRFEEMVKKHGGSTGEQQPLQHRGLGAAISTALSPIYGTRTNTTVSLGDGVEFCTRNYLTLGTQFCSYQIAQSEKLASFLSLRAESGSNIAARINQLAGVFVELDTELWIRLSFPCLDKVFELICFAGKTHDAELLDALFCKCLVNILKILLKTKATETNTLPAKYLAKAFCAPNVFLPLADALHRLLTRSPSSVTPVEIIVLTLKFAVLSYRQYTVLCSKLQRSLPDDVLLNLKIKLNEIFRRLTELSVKDSLLRQRCLPEVIEIISDGFCDRAKLYSIIIADVLPAMSTEKELLDFYRVLAKSHISSMEGQTILLPPMLNKCCAVLEEFSLKNSAGNRPADAALQVLYMALMVLQEVVDNISADISKFAKYSSLPMLPVFQLSLRITCLVSHSHDSFWLAMNTALSSGKLMTVDALERHFSSPAFAHPLEIADFLSECLMSIERLFSNDATLRNLASFVYMRNSIIVHILSIFGQYIAKHLATYNSMHIISCLRQFMHSFLSFMLQPALEVERCSENFQSQRFAAVIGDLRLSAANILVAFWNNLGKTYRSSVSKILFQSDASIVQVALSCLPELRRTACLILKDILKLEFEQAYANRRRSAVAGGTFLETSGCISLFLQGIDYLVIKWPHMSKEFYSEFVNVFSPESQTPIASASQNSLDILAYIEKQVALLLETVENQLLFLEDYIAAVTKSSSPVTELTCLRRMILFYQKKELTVPYVTHLSTLYQRQLGRQMFAEAAVALEELSSLVSWTDEALPVVLQNLTLVRHSGAQRSFKESLYEKAAELFQEIALFERAIALFRELMDQHMNYTYNFEKLAIVHDNLAGLSRMIATTIRSPPRFFWVTFLGNAPTVLPCLQNTSFIFRSPSHQMMGDFAHLFKGWYPDVPIKHEPPPLGFFNMPAAIYIVTVEPDSGDLVKSKFGNRGSALMKVPERVVSYYRVNQVQRFFHVRTKKHADGSIRGECFDLECAYAMPYMLEWADVKLEKVNHRDVDAVQLAYYDVNKKNIELRGALDAYQSTKNDVKNAQQDLQRCVKGVVDAPIGGGIFMYVPCFTASADANSETSQRPQLQQLQEVIVEQFHLVTEGMKCLKYVICTNIPDLRGLYDFMEMQYGKYSQAVADIKAWPGRNPHHSDLIRRNTAPKLDGNVSPKVPHRGRAATEIEGPPLVGSALPPRAVLSTPEPPGGDSVFTTPVLRSSTSVDATSLNHGVTVASSSRRSNVMSASTPSPAIIEETLRPVSSERKSADSLGENGASVSRTSSASPLPEGFVPYKPKGPPPPVPPKRKNLAVPHN